MIEDRKGSLDENRISFEDRLKDFSLPDRQSIIFAYDIAKAAHRGQERDSGIRYFEHPREVALILLVECSIKSPNLIIGGLLHDVLEDTSIFGNSQYSTQDELINAARSRIPRVFGEEVAEIIISVSKPNGKDLQEKTKAEINEMYHENLEGASSEALLVKMADRLHNLRTLAATSKEKQKRKLKETEEIYFPLFKRVLEKYPRVGSFLFEQMIISINQLHRSSG